VTTPPPLPRKKPAIHLWVWLIVIVAVVWTLGSFVYVIITSGLTKGVDNQFGDQNLKTAVALIELHKIRYGKYPASLKDLKFTGQWDQIALNSVRYHANPAGNAYYIEVERGWMGKPTLTMPSEFWRGTGYSPSLKRDN